MVMAVCANGYLPNNIVVVAKDSQKLSGKTLAQVVALAQSELACTGCVGTVDLGSGSVTVEKIAAPAPPRGSSCPTTARRSRGGTSRGAAPSRGSPPGRDSRAAGPRGNVPLSVASSYRLPQGCTAGKIASFSGTVWSCATDANTTYAPGTGLSLAGTTFSVDPTVVQSRVTGSCGANQAIAAIAQAGTVTCRSIPAVPAAWLLGGNAGTDPASNFMGTTDNQPLIFEVNGIRALRIEPTTDTPNIIGGFSGNSVTAGVVGATISGGGGSGANFCTSPPNTVTDDFGTVGGGCSNRAGDDAGNLFDGQDATVGGGFANIASGAGATVGGGNHNSAAGRSAVVSGGAGNHADAVEGTVGGGRNDVASGTDATVDGGCCNTASGPVATVGGGGDNTASGNAATVGGGISGTASGDYATVGGGTTNTASGPNAVVGGGTTNTASGDGATVGGGYRNTASLAVTTIGGGVDNRASGTTSTVGGGGQNTASGSGATVSGGGANTASGADDMVGGGNSNTASGGFATVGGGTATLPAARVPPWAVVRTTAPAGTAPPLAGAPSTRRAEPSVGRPASRRSQTTPARSSGPTISASISIPTPSRASTR